MRNYKYVPNFENYVQTDKVYETSSSIENALISKN